MNQNNFAEQRNYILPPTPPPPPVPPPGYKKEEVKYFTSGMVSLGTFFGGFPAGIYFLAVNYYNMGKKIQAFITTLAGLVFMLTTAIFFVYFDKQIKSSFHFYFYLLYAVLITSIMKISQNKEINMLIENGAKEHSGWRVFGIIIVSVLTYMFFLSIIYIFMSVIGVITIE